MTVTAPVTELRLRNDLGELDRLHAAIDAFGAQHHLPSRPVFELNLALDEWLTNIVAYGYDDTQPHHIAVRLCLEVTTVGRVITVEIVDDARPFNPLAVPPPQLYAPLVARSVGGLGIHFVRRCMDAVTYERAGGHNRLLLRKHVVG